MFMVFDLIDTQNIELEFTKINLFIGVDGIGKSSISQL